jgi:hypothetical protein
MEYAANGIPGSVVSEPTWRGVKKRELLIRRRFMVRVFDDQLCDHTSRAA